jgi:hypothetical protein
MYRWTIQAQVIKKSQLLLMESIKPGVPPTKYFFVELADGSGTIRARACTAKNCDKFYPLLKVNIFLLLINLLDAFIDNQLHLTN